MNAKPEIVFRTPWFQIGVVDPGAEPSGTTAPYYCLVRRAGVLACMFDREGRVVLVEQYRPPLGRVTLEMPAGTIDEGETPDQTVAREALEETGYVCERWYQISPFRLMLNREDVLDYFYIGLGAHGAAESGAAENGTVRLIPRRDFLDMVTAGRFEQTAALGGVYLAEKIFGIDLLTTDLDHIAAKLEAGR
jgi:ADP-ribose pyrophosphatase